MWEQLIRRQDRDWLGIDFEQIESPFFCEKDHPERLEPFGFFMLIYDGGGVTDQAHSANRQLD